jgi:hypothetical protein
MTNTAPLPDPTVLLDRLAHVASPRWHEARRLIARRLQAERTYTGAPDAQHVSCERHLLGQVFLGFAYGVRANSSSGRLGHLDYHDSKHSGTHAVPPGTCGAESKVDEAGLPPRPIGSVVCGALLRRLVDALLRCLLALPSPAAVAGNAHLASLVQLHFAAR